MEEFIDIAEIIFAISEHKGISLRGGERIRLEKKEKRGGFEKKLFQGRFRSSFIMALLSKLGYVEMDVNTITLHIKQ